MCVLACYWPAITAHWLTLPAQRQDYPRFEDVVREGEALDEAVRASGFSTKEETELERVGSAARSCGALCLLTSDHAAAAAPAGGHGRSGG